MRAAALQAVVRDDDDGVQVYHVVELLLTLLSTLDSLDACDF